MFNEPSSGYLSNETRDIITIAGFVITVLQIIISFWISRRKSELSKSNELRKANTKTNPQNTEAVIWLHPVLYVFWGTLALSLLFSFLLGLTDSLASQEVLTIGIRILFSILVSLSIFINYGAFCFYLDNIVEQFNFSKRAGYPIVGGIFFIILLISSLIFRNVDDPNASWFVIWLTYTAGFWFVLSLVGVFMMLIGTIGSLFDEDF